MSVVICKEIYGGLRRGFLDLYLCRGDRIGGGNEERDRSVMTGETGLGRSKRSYGNDVGNRLEVAREMVRGWRGRCHSDHEGDGTGMTLKIEKACSRCPFARG